jgi:hypothetical protein
MLVFKAIGTFSNCKDRAIGSREGVVPSKIETISYNDLNGHILYS